jgi:hypothetical protein
MIGARTSTSSYPLSLWERVRVRADEIESTSRIALTPALSRREREHCIARSSNHYPPET